MDKPMTASEKSITDGQIENLVDKFRAALRKHRTEIPSEVAQQVLGIESIRRDVYICRPFTHAAASSRCDQPEAVCHRQRGCLHAAWHE